jgi:hypothetical protein
MASGTRGLANAGTTVPGDPRAIFPGGCTAAFGLTIVDEQAAVQKLEPRRIGTYNPFRTAAADFMLGSQCGSPVGARRWAACCEPYPPHHAPRVPDTMWRYNHPRGSAADRRRRPSGLGGCERLETRLALAAAPLPFVQSISLAGIGSAANSLAWKVAFSEPVTGVDAADFKLALSGVTATTPLTVTGSGAAYTVTAGDVAGSGTIGLDLVDDGSIRDLSGNPLGKPGAVSFSSQTRQLAVGSGPISVAVSDVNSDNASDLIVANYFGNSVSVLLGKGDGTFLPQSQTACGTAPIAVAVGDFNGDGKPDLATANYFGNSVSVLLGKGDGTFAPQQSFATGARPVSIAIGFFDDNATADLAVANNDDGTLGILLGTGDGGFGSQRAFFAGSNPTSAVVGDFNSDLQDDVAVASYGTNAILVMAGQGDGTVALTNVYPANPLYGNVEAAAQSPRLYATKGSPWAIGLGDVNGNGRRDIVSANAGTSTLAVLLGSGAGTFQPLSQQAATGTNPLAVVVADVNADGRADVLVTNTGSDTLGVLVGNGTGSFQPQQAFATGRSPRAVAVADFDGDRKPDVVTASFSDNTLGVRSGNLTGGFTGMVARVDTVAPTLSITASPTSLRAGQSATITFTLSENSTTFALADVVATGGTLSAFAGSGKSYKATFTPAVDSTAAGTISVAAATFTDEAGNGNLAASLAPPLVIDTVLPTVVITTAAASLRTGQSTTVTFTLSKPPRSFSLALVAASGGRLSGFKAVSSTVYTATFTAGSNTASKGRISVAAGRFTDAAGNRNVASSLASPISILP